MKNSIKSILPHIYAVLFMLFVAVIYFLPQVQGKQMKSSDIVHYQAMAKEAHNFEDETGRVMLWTNSMFGGMPTYQITGPQKKNLMKPLRELQRLFIPRPIGYFVSGMIGFYILMLILGVNPLLAVLGSLVFAFSTNNLVLFEAGHMSKLASVFSIPLFLAGVLLSFRKKYLIGGIVFTIGLALNILHNHLQMTYLLGILIAILLGFYFFKYLKENELKHFLKVVVIFIVGSILALATSSSKIWTTYEYSKDTMRGKPILESQTEGPLSSSQTEGLEWNYAMQWSNGWEDLLSSFIAGAIGGGSAEPVSNNSAFAKKYRQLSGRGLQNPQAPLYWGKLPGTSGPIYFGAVVFFLFLFGALIVRGKFKWWIITGVVLTMLWSLGNSFEIFNHFMFDYFPYFNKFRSPNSILSLTAFLIPLLGILGVKNLMEVEDKTKLLKKLFISAGILMGISLILMIFGTSMFDFSNASDARYQEMGLLDAIISDRKDLLVSDSLKSFIYIGLAGSLIWLFIKNKIKSIYLIAGLGLIAMIDLLSVDLRYLSHNDFESKTRVSTDFKKRAVDIDILRDPSIHYRVLDLSINTFNSSLSSYYHKTIGGYHAAKLQRFQDLIDKHIVTGNQKVLNMLNTKYYIQGQPGKEQLAINNEAMGNAWSIDSLILVDSANDEIDALKDFDPQKSAIIHNEFAPYYENINLSGNSNIELKEYAPDRMIYESNSNGDDFVVFSEIWYGPDKGWKAYVDGEEVDFVRVNYALRGMKISGGKHEIVFEFHPKAYYLGENISLVSSFLLILLLLGWFVRKPIMDRIRKPEKKQ